MASLRKPLDDETGLYYYGARYYNPFIGRFITPDSIVQAPSDPQSLNRYAYVRNNPVKYVDPSGRFPWLAVIIGAIIGAGAGAVSSYQATGQVQWNSVLLNAVLGGLSGYAIGLATTPTILKIAAGFSLGSQVTSAMPGRTWGDISRYSGYTATALTVAYTGYEIAKGVKDWAVGKGQYYHTDGTPLTEAEIIERYGQDGAKVYTNGIMMTQEEALKAAQKAGADVLFYNPSRGGIGIADFTESFLETITGTGSLDRQLGNLATQLRVDLIGYSQGSLISSNALIHAALKGGAVEGSSITTMGTAVGSIRTHLSAWSAGVTKIYGETNFFDPIKLISSEIWPPGYVWGAVGLVTGGGEHVNY